MVKNERLVYRILSLDPTEFEKCSSLLEIKAGELFVLKDPPGPDLFCEGKKIGTVGLILPEGGELEDGTRVNLASEDGFADEQGVHKIVCDPDVARLQVGI